MSWDEWEQLKAGAATRQPDLRTDPTGKSMAVRALEEDIQPGADRAGNRAEESSNVAVREFTGWDTGAGLKDAHQEWELQVRNLKARLAADKAALRANKREFRQVDHGVGSGLAQIDAGTEPRRDV
ncbi:hypothetical protein [Streptomyces sp. B93]|uniref:hypothetical protein n=1 Tax=Streptomyces sp. B93 TaxID=2824875 RepID=UPI001B37E836|nr:hypothetical protein [Streptomyces sp. B93]MBQ1089522.1 hypothetical protein [Streptomyces sp. B93]